MVRERKSHTGGYTVSHDWWQKSVQELTRTKGGDGKFHQGVRKGPQGGLEMMLPQQTGKGGKSRQREWQNVEDPPKTELHGQGLLACQQGQATKDLDL